MCHAFARVIQRTSVARAAWACAGTLLLSSPAVLAEDAPNLLTDTWQASIGTFGISSEPSVELRGESGGGSKVDFNEAIGGGDAYRFRLDGQWRWADRHKVRFSAFDLSRSKTRTIDEEIEWGDQVYPVNAKVDFEHDFYVIEAVYDYSFLRRENYEIAASAGLHWTGFSASLKVKATDTTAQRKEDASVDMPLPVFGLRGVWSLTHNFWLEAAAQYFALSIDEYDGNLQDYRIFVTWQPHKWVGFGLGYNAFKVDVDVDADNFNGSLDWNYDGPMAFYNVSF
jgi:hypothetical protein